LSFRVTSRNPKQPAWVKRSREWWGFKSAVQTIEKEGEMKEVKKSWVALLLGL